ncbi:glycosyltransferase family 4 protein [Thermaurantiacus sp.]
MPDLRVLVLAYQLNGEGVGETYSAFRLVEALSRQAKLTVLGTRLEPRHTPLAQQLPHAEVVAWPDPDLLPAGLRQVAYMAKPWLPLFNRRAAAWIRDALLAGRRFDVAHQVLPQAPRYACPLRFFDMPYVLGPLGGGLETPAGFRHEFREASAAARLRVIDGWRLRNDPGLRQGIARAGLVLGVAPYVHENLARAGLGHVRFKPMLERSCGVLPELPLREAVPGRARLLHVGRVIRSKGLVDVIRALAQLRDLPEVRLTSVGDGPDLDVCRQEAASLGVADRVTFRGRIPRDAVDREYAAADIFCFPSFREPMGGVLFEAMEWGLPIIAANRGGPQAIVDPSCGIQLDVEAPEQLAADIAHAVRQLAHDPGLRHRLGEGARARLRSFGTWEERAAELLDNYRSLLDQAQGADTLAGQG